jgi:hypothetical protein
LEKLYEHTNHYKNQFDQFRKIKKNKKVDIVNTGSTLAYFGIDYDSCYLNGLNLSHKPQSLEYDLKLLKHFAYALQKNAIVLIIISDLAFGLTKYENKNNEKYYRILNSYEIEEYSLWTAIKIKLFPVTQHWKNIFRFLRDVPRDREYEQCVNENDYEAVEADALKRNNNWCKEFNLPNLSSTHISTDYQHKFDITCGYVQEMIEWSIKNNFHPILVNLPISSAMRSFFSKEFLDVYYYNNIIRANTMNIPFIDLWHDERLQNYLLYIDSIRLNRAGREIVTKIIINEIKKMGLIDD